MVTLIPAMPALAFSYSKNFGSAYGTYALGCWPAILEGYAFRVLHFSLGTALHTVCLHLADLLTFRTDGRLAGDAMSIASGLCSWNTRMFCSAKQYFLCPRAGDYVTVATKFDK